MSFEFKTELFGLEVQVEGYFEAGEAPSHDCPGSEPEYHIESITHKGEEFEIDSLPDDILWGFVKEAFQKSTDEHDPY